MSTLRKGIAINFALAIEFVLFIENLIMIALKLAAAVLYLQL